MEAQSNILDPVQTDARGDLTLDPRVWDHASEPKPKLKPKHLHWIKRTIYEALEKNGYQDPKKWLKLCLTGSLCTYQYSDSSDVDLSLFVDSKVFPEWSRAEMIGIMVSTVDGTKLPGTPHPMQDFVVQHGIKPDDLYKPGLRSGYDVDKQQWIVPPDPHHVFDIEHQENGFYTYALQVADKMEKLLRYEPHKAIEYWHQIHRKRREDERAGKGDASEANVIYKMLDQRGLFPQIADVSGEYLAHKTAAGDWFAPAYMIPNEVKQQIHNWVQSQQWPEGTRFAPPERYHVTGLYSPVGFSEPSHHEWIAANSGLTYPVQISGHSLFSPSDRDGTSPYVLRLENPELSAHTEQLMNEAEQRGLPISRFEGGYKPHITVAHVPQEIDNSHPPISFQVGPMRELHNYYDELKDANTERQLLGSLRQKGASVISCSPFTIAKFSDEKNWARSSRHLSKV